MNKKIFTFLLGITIAINAWSNVIINQSVIWNVGYFTTNPTPTGTVWRTDLPKPALQITSGNLIIDRQSNLNRVEIIISDIDIMLPEGSKIIVDQGESLIFSDVDVYPNGKYWDGIYVNGQSAIGQFNPNSSTSIPKIYEAYNSTTTYDPNQTILKVSAQTTIYKSLNGLVSNNGGIIIAVSSFFTDNLKSIQFNEYTHPNYGSTNLSDRNASYIENCTFRNLLPTPFIFDQTYLNKSVITHITLNKVKGVHIAGCGLSLNKNANDNCGQLGTGIYSSNSSVIIRNSGIASKDPNSDCYSYNGQSTRIKDMTNGIVISEVSVNGVIPESNVVIKNTEIIGVQNGISASYLHRLTVDESTIDSRDFDNGINPNSSCGNVNLLLLSNVKEFVIGSNNLYSENPNLNTSDFNHINVINCGNASNIIYLNNIKSFDFGHQPNGVKISSNNQGLEIFCNNFENMYNGILIEANATPNSTIKNAENNGTANNTFIGSSNFDLNNQSNITIEYYIKSITDFNQLNKNLFAWSPNTLAPEFPCSKYLCDKWPSLSSKNGLLDINYKIYPNPVKTGNYITIKLPENFKFTKNINIFDLNGKLMKEIDISELKNFSDIEIEITLPSGFYIIEFDVNNVKQKSKMIVTN